MRRSVMSSSIASVRATPRLHNISGRKSRAYKDHRGGRNTFHGDTARSTASNLLPLCVDEGRELWYRVPQDHPAGYSGGGESSRGYLVVDGGLAVMAAVLEVERRRGGGSVGVGR